MRPEGEHPYYVSTYCDHGMHDLCGAKQWERGDTTEAHCKSCLSPCRCTYPYHRYQHRIEQQLQHIDRAHGDGCVLAEGHTGYCQTEAYPACGESTTAESLQGHMMRLVCGLPRGHTVDHRDGDYETEWPLATERN